MSKIKTEKANPDSQINISTSISRPKLSGSLSFRKTEREPIVIPDFPSVPDFGFQLATCAQIGEVPPDIIRNAVREQLAKPDADVRPECHSENGQQTYKIYAWLEPPIDAIDRHKRDLAMDKLSVLPNDKFFTFFINGSAIRRYVRDEYDKIDKRYNEDGFPQSDGPIHLGELSIEFEQDNKIITTIHGYDETPWPDLSFDVRITDVFGVSEVSQDTSYNPIDNNIVVDNTLNIHKDTSPFKWLTLFGLFTGNVPVVVVFGGQWLIIALAAPNPGKIANVGEYVRRSFPPEWYLPSGKKIAFTYDDVKVDAGGIFASGKFGDLLELERNPRIIEIWGPRSIRVPEGLKTIEGGPYWVVADDLRHDFRIDWSVDGSVVKTTSVNRTDTKTWVSFNCEGATSKDPKKVELKIRVTDADNKFAEAHLTLNIYSTPPVDPDGDGRPPICKIRPWLPQCKSDD